jgi:hypothetical protein
MTIFEQLNQKKWGEFLISSAEVNVVNYAFGSVLKVNSAKIYVGRLAHQVALVIEFVDVVALQMKS